MSDLCAGGLQWASGTGVGADFILGKAPGREEIDTLVRQAEKIMNEKGEVPTFINWKGEERSLAEIMFYPLSSTEDGQRFNFKLINMICGLNEEEKEKYRNTIINSFLKLPLNDICEDDNMRLMRKKTEDGEIEIYGVFGMFKELMFGSADQQFKNGMAYGKEKEIFCHLLKGIKLTEKLSTLNPGYKDALKYLNVSLRLMEMGKELMKRKINLQNEVADLSANMKKMKNKIEKYRNECLESDTYRSEMLKSAFTEGDTEMLKHLLELKDMKRIALGASRGRIFLDWICASRLDDEKVATSLKVISDKLKFDWAETGALMGWGEGNVFTVLGKRMGSDKRKVQEYIGVKSVEDYSKRLSVEKLESLVNEAKDNLDAKSTEAYLNAMQASLEKLIFEQNSNPGKMGVGRRL